MTPEERDRLARLEADYENLVGWVKKIDGKLDQILEAAAMGRGAWWLLLKIGAVVMAVVTLGTIIGDRLHVWR